MRIRRTRSTVEWTQVPNVIARDYRITWRARGLLLELLSYPPGWETTIDKVVAIAQARAKQLGGKVEGRDAMRAAARELKAVGYIVVTKYQDAEGHWVTEWHVTEDPMWDLLSSRPTDDGFPVVGLTSGNTDESPARTDDGFPVVGSPVVGFPGVPKKTEKKKETPPPSEAPVTSETRTAAVVQEEEALKRRDSQSSHRSRNEGTVSSPVTDTDEAALGEAYAVLNDATARWRGHRAPRGDERRKLAVRIAEALAAGSTPAAVVEVLTHDLSRDQVRSAVAVVMTRTAVPGWWREVRIPLQPTTAPRPPWCGVCNESTRQRENEQGKVVRCKACHPFPHVRDENEQDSAPVVEEDRAGGETGRVPAEAASVRGEPCESHGRAPRNPDTGECVRCVAARGSAKLGAKAKKPRTLTV